MGRSSSVQGQVGPPEMVKKLVTDWDSPAGQQSVSPWEQMEASQTTVAAGVTCADLHPGRIPATTLLRRDSESCGGRERS